MIHKDISLPISCSESELRNRILRRLSPSEKGRLAKPLNFRILRKSLDARRKDQLLWRYRILLCERGEELPPHDSLCAPDLPVSSIPAHPPLVVGSGPAGLFATLYLARAGLKPILVEQGEAVLERVQSVEAFWQGADLNPWSNAQFGEGGAGTFSDGKLHTGTRSPWIAKVFDSLIKAGAPESIRYDAQPHIGTDKLPDILMQMRSEIQSLGGSIRFGTQFIGFKEESSELREEKHAAKHLVFLKDLRTGQISLEAVSVLFLAIGHSSRETYALLAEAGMALEAKPMAMGVRIEHTQHLLDHAQYGGKNLALHRSELPATAYKLTEHTHNGGAAYSFCMCPGGEVIACASEVEQVVTNGMSRSDRGGVKGNSALLVPISVAEYERILLAAKEGRAAEPCFDPRFFTPRARDRVENWLARCTRYPALMGIYYQECLEARAYSLGGEGYAALAQTVGDFLNPKATREEEQKRLESLQPTYRPRVKSANFDEALPHDVITTLRNALPSFGKKIKGFDDPEAILLGVETRSSAPVRILRTPDERSSLNFDWIYPIGEGAGYAGGITSSAVDGLKSVFAWFKTSLLSHEDEQTDNLKKKERMDELI